LDAICSNFHSLARTIHVTIVTNADDDLRQRAIKNVVAGKGIDYSLYVPRGLGHPFLLTWSHFSVFRDMWADQSISHFLYVEDDLLLKKENIDYWLDARELLRPFGLIPSFLRCELKSGDDECYSTDMSSPVSAHMCPHIELAFDKAFLNVPNPYQGLYFLDRELMSEHLNGSSSHPDFGYWLIREKAAQGVTFLNVPTGWTSRNVIPYDPGTNRIKAYCLVHHLPNNYAEDPNTSLGKTKISELLLPSKAARYRLTGRRKKYGVLQPGRYDVLRKNWIPPVAKLDLRDWLPPIILRGLQTVKRFLKSYLEA
jgi:hypothetical protein